jgi:hypothetical protein
MTTRDRTDGLCCQRAYQMKNHFRDLRSGNQIFRRIAAAAILRAIIATPMMPVPVGP